MSDAQPARSIADRCIRAVLRIWFAPAKPYDLAIARLAFFGYALAQEWQQTFWWAPLPSDIIEPAGIMRWLPMLTVSQLVWLLWAFRLTAFLAFIGLGYRFAAGVASACLLYFLGLENCFGKVMHSANLYVIGAVVLACSRADDALSVKAWLARRRGQAAPSPSGEYRWPVRTIWLILAGMYCAAGVSKLTHTGWDWALSDNFRNLLLSHQYTRAPVTGWGPWLAQYPDLCRWVAAGALAMELAAPLLLLGGGFTLIFGGGLMALQLGIFLMLGVNFSTMLPVFLTLVPWTWLFTGGAGLLGFNLEKGSGAETT